MTRTLSAAEAKTHFSESLRLAEAGEIVQITRYGKPVAALVSADQIRSLQRLRAAGPEEGLGSLLGRFKDGDELAAELDRVVAGRSEPREIPELGR